MRKERVVSVKTELNALKESLKGMLLIKGLLDYGKDCRAGGSLRKFRILHAASLQGPFRNLTHPKETKTKNPK